MILNCSDYLSTKESVLKIFDVSCVLLEDFFKHVSALCDVDELGGDLILSQACEIIGEPRNHQVVWFHGGRAKNEMSFYEKGIVPKKHGQAIICQELKELLDGACDGGSDRFSNSISFKNSLGCADEGPFAYLFKGAFSCNSTRCTNYAETPEGLEDVASKLCGDGYEELIRCYKKATKSFLVSFIEPAEGDEIGCALYYLFLRWIDYSECSAIDNSIGVFNAEGRAIRPEKILSVDRLDCVV